LILDGKSGLRQLFREELQKEKYLPKFEENFRLFCGCIESTPKKKSTISLQKHHPITMRSSAATGVALVLLVLVALCASNAGAFRDNEPRVEMETRHIDPDFEPATTTTSSKAPEGWRMTAKLSVRTPPTIRELHLRLRLLYSLSLILMKRRVPIGVYTCTCEFYSMIHLKMHFVHILPMTLTVE